MRTSCNHYAMNFMFVHPDVQLGKGRDITTIPQAIAWFMRGFAHATFRPHRMRKIIFKNKRGICIIHGDTLTTLLSLYFAKRACLKVAHLEAGLTSRNYLSPFPEEIIRNIVMKFSDLLFAFSDDAYRNMDKMLLKGEKYNLYINTNIESILFSQNQQRSRLFDVDRYCLITIHRFETLYDRRKVKKIVDLVFRVSSQKPVVFVLHPQTKLRLKKYNYYSDMLKGENITLSSLLPHRDFIHLLKNADFVITDGGSVQEECFYLKIPCLLMRKKTERLEGLGENIYLSEFCDKKVDYFLSSWEQLTSSETIRSGSPSEKIINNIIKYRCAG